jgi:Terpene cyclase DEP1
MSRKVLCGVYGAIARVALAATILMVIEAGKYHIPFVWAYILGSALVAVSVTVPLS